jgi:hypothetical protein
MLDASGASGASGRAALPPPGGMIVWLVMVNIFDQSSTIEPLIININ